MQKIVEELHKRNINCTCNSKIKVVKNLLYMEIHRIHGLRALFFDNLQKTLQKLIENIRSSIQ